MVRNGSRSFPLRYPWRWLEALKELEEAAEEVLVVVKESERFEEEEKGEIR